MSLTTKEIVGIFHGLNLVDQYNFVEDDLVKLANAFISAAEPKIAQKELDKCIKFVNSLNPEVARALQDYRKNV